MEAADGAGWNLDGLEIGEGEEVGEGVGEAETLGGERVLRHRRKEKGEYIEEVRERGVAKRVGGWARFDVRKSWRAGAEGEEVTLFARDKSWLFWEVVQGQLGGGEWSG